MKVSEITGTIVDPRGNPEFDEAERDRYVARFLAALEIDCTEDERVRLVGDIHMQVRTEHDLYIGIFDALPSRYRSAIRTYVKAYGNPAS
jgi:hypothetical protein